MDGLVVLDVQDNGVGFDTTRLSISLVEQPAGGFGLKALRERVEQLGGMLSIENSWSEGTTIAVALPAAGNKPPSPQEAAKEVV
jgi:signal transduction histidine kinase